MSTQLNTTNQNLVLSHIDQLLSDYEAKVVELVGSSRAESLLADMQGVRSQSGLFSASTKPKSSISFIGQMMRNVFCKNNKNAHKANDIKRLYFTVVGIAKDMQEHHFTNTDVATHLTDQLNIYYNLNDQRNRFKLITNHKETTHSEQLLRAAAKKIAALGNKTQLLSTTTEEALAAETANVEVAVTAQDDNGSVCSQESQRSNAETRRGSVDSTDGLSVASSSENASNVSGVTNLFQKVKASVAKSGLTDGRVSFWAQPEQPVDVSEWMRHAKEEGGLTRFPKVSETRNMSFI